MRKLSSFAAVVLASSCATTMLGPGSGSINYWRIRYGGFGEANPARDKQVVADFEKMRVERNRLRQLHAPGTMDSTERKARIAELEAAVAQPAHSHMEELRLEARRSELERLKAAPTDGEPPPSKKIVGDDVVVLVDTLPAGVEEKDGHLTTTGDAELLGKFSVQTGWAVDESLLVEEMRAMGAAAGGNVVVLSFRHGAEGQGECLGAAGLVIKQPDFDPKKTTPGHVPTEI